MPNVINWMEGGKTPLMSADGLYELGFRLMMCEISLLLAATSAVQERLQRIRDLGGPQITDAVAFDEFNQLIGMPGVFGLDSRFVSSQSAPASN